MSFIKHYWFSALLAVLLICFVGVFTLVLLSPKQDMQGRGFIPCTEKMIDDLFDCDKKIWCSAKAIVRDNICVFHVIFTGAKDWGKGKQPAPWSNYIFDAETYPAGFVDEEARKKYLEEHPDVKDEMERLYRLRKDMENENNEQIEFESFWKQEQ